jgi:glycosyltransferase involved in cell wall biosynthesis
VRILKVVQAYYPFQEKGGPVVKVRALARGLARRGHDVTVLTADLGLAAHAGLAPPPEPCEWGWRLRQDGVEAIYLPTAAHYRAITLNPRVFAYCRASLSRFDVVHIYGLYDLLGPAVARACRREGIVYVVEPMGMFRPIVRSLRLKRFYHELLGNSLLAGACRLIATSEQEKREFVEGGIGAGRIVIRRNGVDFPETLPEKGEFRRKWGIQSDAIVILFLGRMVSKKSPDLLLKAFAQWRRKASRGSDAVLVLAGPDEGDGFIDRLRKMAERYELGQSVLFVGPVYDEAKWQAYRDADVFVLASLSENFGNTAAESAACGTPVIVTDCCGIAQYVGEAGIVIPHDVGALEGALDRLLEDPSLWRRCHESCAGMARSLSWNDPLIESEHLYTECREKHTRRGRTAC